MPTNRGGAPTDARALIGLLERQVQLYDSLQALADRQRRFIAAGDTAPLLKLLAERKRLTTELARMNEDMARIRGRWTLVREGLDADQRARAEQLIGRANERLEKLIASDEEDARHLAMQKERVGQELGRVQSKRAAVNAYRSAGAPTSCLDRVHE